MKNPGAPLLNVVRELREHPIATVAAIATVSGSALSAAIWNAEILQYFAIAGIGVFSGALIVAAKRRSSAPPGPNPGLHIISLYDTFEIKGGDLYINSRRIVARALTHGVAEYIHNFNWTGFGSVSVRATTPGYDAVLFNDDASANRGTRVRFDRPKTKNAEFEFEYALTLHDEGRAMRPFLAFSPVHAVDRAVMKVKFPKGMLHPKYRQLEYEHSSNSFPKLERELALEADDTQISWEITDPVVGSRYSLTWRYSDEAASYLDANSPLRDGRDA